MELSTRALLELEEEAVDFVGAIRKEEKKRDRKSTEIQHNTDKLKHNSTQQKNKEKLSVAIVCRVS